jgi:RNA polymerase sigma factor (sigma-70 family)
MASSAQFVVPAELSLWLRDAQGGSRAALENLMAFCRSYLMHLGGCPIDGNMRAKEDEEDLVQDTLLKFLHSFRTMRDPTVAEVLDRLCCIRERTWRNYVRRYRSLMRNVRREEERINAGPDNDALDRLAAALFTPYDEAVRSEQKKLLRTVVRRLPGKHRWLLYWHYWKGWGFDEIGLRLGITGPAAQQRHIKILRQLKRELRGLQ